VARLPTSLKHFELAEAFMSDGAAVSALFHRPFLILFLDESRVGRSTRMAARRLTPHRPANGGQ
jgi:hypothetical protein